MSVMRGGRAGALGVLGLVLVAAFSLGLPGYAHAEPTAKAEAPNPDGNTAPAADSDVDYAPDAAKPAAPAAPTPPPADLTATPPPGAPERLGAEVRKALAETIKVADPAGDAAALAAFYLARGDEPLWISDDRLSAKGEAAIAEIKSADDWGLEAKAFDLPTVSGALDTAQQADTERRLSLAALAYARHARGGRIAEPASQLSSYLDRVPQLLEPKIVLDEIAKSEDVAKTLTGFHPKHPQFERQRQAYLALLKGAAEAPKVVLLPKTGPTLSPGQKHADVGFLRQRLNVAAPAPQADGKTDETVYDAPLVDAVKAFQTSKGLRPDGIVGAGTRAALNDIDLPNPARHLANMEQWRWMPEDLGKTYIWVNIPEFMIRVVKDDAIIHEERVVTGLVDKQTPVFSDEMELVTFHPRWHVPQSIKVRELYPSLARGGTSFQRQGLKLSQNGRPVDPESVDWSSADIRKFDVVQPPGASNVLGVVKFSFPNKHTVYMHDTSSKGLFEEASRPFSHGCMRVRNPLKLAEIILGADKGWDGAKIAEIASGNPVETPITLETKVPVHITYFSSWIGDDGKEQRFKDVYGHEQRVTLALAGRFSEIAKGPDHLAPVSYPKTRYASDGNPFESFMKNMFGGF